MKFTRILSLILALILAFSTLVACGGDKTTKPTGNGGGNGTGADH